MYTTKRDNTRTSSKRSDAGLTMLILKWPNIGICQPNSVLKVALCMATLIFIFNFNATHRSDEFMKYRSYDDADDGLSLLSPVINNTSKLETGTFETIKEETTKKTEFQSETLIRGNQSFQGELNFTREYLKTVSPDIFQRIPTQYLPNYRGFCWFEEDQLWCLPYFYIIGFHKCGTTDIFDKLRRHPDVLKVGKEPHWWALRRAGLHRDNYSLHKKLNQEVSNLPGIVDSTTFNWYLHWYKQQHVLHDVKTSTRKLRSENGELIEYHPKVFGDGSVSTISHVIYSPWDRLVPNGEDPDILPYLMHAVQPRAKVIISVRDPVARFHSIFAKRMGGRNSNHLHGFAVSSVNCATNCIANHSVRYCAHYSHCAKFPQLYLGIYIEFIQPWAMIYGKENLFVSRMEDRIKDPLREFRKLLQYLELDMLPDKECKRIVSGVSNKTRGKVAMLDKTRNLLQEFYKPFNRRMAAFMNDDSYNFGY
ncbi:carbohydrate sulfotransferase 15-like isoform X2 [Apostichopus japonicus]